MLIRNLFLPSSTLLVYIYINKNKINSVLYKATWRIPKQYFIPHIRKHVSCKLIISYFGIILHTKYQKAILEIV